VLDGEEEYGPPPFHTRDVFWQMPNLLLAPYFQERRLFFELNFAAMKETKPDRLFAVWLELPEGDRILLSAEFEEIAAMNLVGALNAAWIAGKPATEVRELVTELESARRTAV
jgi:hypothetical protein